MTHSFTTLRSSDLLNRMSPVMFLVCFYEFFCTKLFNSVQWNSVPIFSFNIRASIDKCKSFPTLRAPPKVMSKHPLLRVARQGASVNPIRRAQRHQISSRLWHVGCRSCGVLDRKSVV